MKKKHGDKLHDIDPCILPGDNVVLGCFPQTCPRFRTCHLHGRQHPHTVSPPAQRHHEFPCVSHWSLWLHLVGESWLDKEQHARRLRSLVLTDRLDIDTRAQLFQKHSKELSQRRVEHEHLDAGVSIQEMFHTVVQCSERRLAVDSSHTSTVVLREPRPQLLKKWKGCYTVDLLKGNNRFGHGATHTHTHWCDNKVNMPDYSHCINIYTSSFFSVPWSL